MPTLDALIRVREYIPDVFAKFIPTQAMYDLFNSDMYKTQAQDLRENINTAEEIDFFGESELILHELNELNRQDLDDVIEEDEESDEEEQVEE